MVDQIERPMTAERNRITTQTGAPARALPLVSVVVPTRNEAGNVPELLRRLGQVMPGTPLEIVFVDDSDDGTDLVVEASREACERDIVLVHRPAERRLGGLGGAVVEGMRVARGSWVCVMDGDLQHPPEIIPELVQRVETAAADLVIASRYRPGGNREGLNAIRAAISSGSTMASKLLLGGNLGGVSDPMSGFFLVRRDAVPLNRLRPDGFKILLEILVRTPELKVAEVPFQFGNRYSGESKAGVREGLRYVRQLRTLARAARTRPTGSATATRNSRGPIYYDIHGLISVRSDVALPELTHFRVDYVDNPDVTVRLAAVRKGVGDTTGPHGERITRYREIVGNAGFACEIQAGDAVVLIASPPLRFSPHVLYTNLVEPVLRWMFVERGYALVHGACIAVGNNALLITARTDTGKTTTMLKALNASPWGFLSDDLTLVDPSGEAFFYPKPLTISKHTLGAVRTPLLTWWQRRTLPIQSRIHSRSGRKAAFFLTRLDLPLATINALVQFLVPPPKYFVQQLIPGVRLVERARLAGMVIISRGGTDTRQLGAHEALTTLLANCEDAYGFPPYRAIEEFLHSYEGKDLKQAERDIIASAFSDKPTTLLESETMDWWERLPAVMSGMFPLESGDDENEGVRPEHGYLRPVRVSS